MRGCDSELHNNVSPKHSQERKKKKKKTELNQKNYRKQFRLKSTQEKKKVADIWNYYFQIIFFLQQSLGININFTDWPITDSNRNTITIFVPFHLSE